MTYATGALLSPPDQRDHQAPRVVGGAPLPAQFIPVMRPPVRNQGSEGTCVGHAVAALLAWCSMRAGFPRDIAPRDVYELARDLDPVQGEGAHVRAALRVARRWGGCEERWRPYVAHGATAALPGADESRPDTKLAAYAAVGLGSRAVREALAVHGPVVAVIDAREGFASLGPGHLASNAGASLGLHAVLLLGYDDYRGAYLAQNSWGPDWGDKGCCWLPYDYPLAEAWTVVPDVVADRPAEVPMVPWWERAMPWIPWY